MGFPEHGWPFLPQLTTFIAQIAAKIGVALPPRWGLWRRVVCLAVAPARKLLLFATESGDAGCREGAGHADLAQTQRTPSSVAINSLSSHKFLPRLWLPVNGVGVSTEPADPEPSLVVSQPRSWQAGRPIESETVCPKPNCHSSQTAVTIAQKRRIHKHFSCHSPSYTSAAFTLTCVSNVNRNLTRFLLH